MSVRGKYLGIPESLVHGEEPNAQCGNSLQLNTTGIGSGGQAEDAVLPGQGSRGSARAWQESHIRKDKQANHKHAACRSQLSTGSTYSLQVLFRKKP